MQGEHQSADHFFKKTIGLISLERSLHAESQGASTEAPSDHLWSLLQARFTYLTMFLPITTGGGEAELSMKPKFIPFVLAELALF